MLHEGMVMNQAVFPDGKLIVSGSADCTLRLWDPETGKELHKLEGQSFRSAKTKHFASGT
jgi:WD40 repeat protein